MTAHEPWPGKGLPFVLVVKGLKSGGGGIPPPILDARCFHDMTHTDIHTHTHTHTYTHSSAGRLNYGSTASAHLGTSGKTSSSYPPACFLEPFLWIQFRRALQLLLNLQPRYPFQPVSTNQMSSNKQLSKKHAMVRDMGCLIRVGDK